MERLAAIENYLNSVEDFGPAEELLLIEWLKNSSAPLKFAYDCSPELESVLIDFDKYNRVSGFRWRFPMDCYAECNGFYGTFSTTLFGWEFSHDAVTYANEDMWYEARWNCDSEDLSFALDNHLGGQLPHIEDWCDSVGNCEAYVKQAFGQYLERKRYDFPDAELRFYLDGGGLAYVMVVDGENHIERFLEPTERPPFMGALTEVSEAEATEAILEQDLPFEQDEY